MKSNHADIELLCVLAVTGDLDQAGQDELREHLGYCTGCRTYLLEMPRLEAGLALARELKSPCRLPTGMQERFILRAAREGVGLHAPVPRGQYRAIHFATALLIVLLLATVTLKAGPFFRLPQPRPTVSASVPGLKAAPQLMTSAKPLYSPLPNSRHTRVVSKTTPIALEHRQFSFTPALLPANAHALLFSKQQYPIPSFTFRFTLPLLAKEEDPVQGRPAGSNFRLLKVDFTADGYRRMQIEGASAQ